MAFFRRRNKTDNYTIVDNFCLQDANLSFAETGLMAYLLHLPADWEIKQSQIENAKIDGRDKVRSLFRSLIKKGYLVKKQARNDSGKFSVDYDVYERPTELNFEVIHNKNNRDGFADTVKPSAVSHPQQNTNTKSFKYNNINLQRERACEGKDLKTNKRSRLELFEVVTKRYSELLTYIAKPELQEVANEVINAIVDMLYMSEHSGFYKANSQQYDLKQIAQLLVKLDDANLRSVIESVHFYANPDMPIRSRDRYIKAAILKQAEASKKIATTDKTLLQDMFQTAFVPDYLKRVAQ